MALQHGLFELSPDDHLLLLEHPHVFTLGARADLEHLLVAPADVGAELVRADRGGGITYHGPGQLVGYPILSVPGKRGGGMADTAAYVNGVEQLLIDVLGDLGLDDVGRLAEYPGVWVEPDGAGPRKIAAVGIRLSRGRSMHGFALNVDPDMAYFGHIVPCGIPELAVTSLAGEAIDASMREVVDAVVARAERRWGGADCERADVAWRELPADLSAFSRDASTRSGPSARLQSRLSEAGVTGGLEIRQRKPAWLRAPLRTERAFGDLARTMRDLDLVTVCEEAGCPNLSECWADGTATFMINGDRCTRACGFCLVDTRHPQPVDPGEPARVAEAVARMGLSFAVLTAVARDDLRDGGAAGFVASIEAIRARTPGTEIEVLIPDCGGNPDALGMIFLAVPDVLNHNIETVPRLQRAVRPSAGYARSLSVLARARQAGLRTKSGLILGLGEERAEVVSTLADLRAVGVDIVTIGQYLRPTARHLPVSRWWNPTEFEDLRVVAQGMGFVHVECSPLTRSSYHARQAADAGSGVVLSGATG